jgi:cysteine desulfurase
VLEVFYRALSAGFGNASSIHHLGQAAKQSVEDARKQVALLLGCHPKEIVFTSGGTEADNHAIFGTTRLRSKPHIITSSIEHPAVLNAAGEVKKRGGEVSLVPVSQVGTIDPDDIRRAIRSDTTLISVMHVNNEIGAVQAIREIAEIAREANVLMHSDGVQAVGRFPLSVSDLGVDLYSISAHKFGGPKGVGALYIRKGVDIGALLYGGRHESGRRAGTENTPGIVAMGQAAKISHMNLESEMPKIAQLRDRLEQGILTSVPDVFVNGAGARRVANTTNLCFEGIEGESLVIALDLQGFCVSSGSACSSGAVEPSHVLLALGLSKAQAKSSVRFSLGTGNTVEQVDELIAAVADATAHLRRLSPTYTAHA